MKHTTAHDLKKRDVEVVMVRDPLVGQCGGRKAQRRFRFVAQKAAKSDHRHDMIAPFLPKEMTELQFPGIRMPSRLSIPNTRHPCEHYVRHKRLFRYRRHAIAVLPPDTSDHLENAPTEVAGEKPPTFCR